MIDLQKYTQFVQAITSKDSESLSEFTGRIHNLSVANALAGVTLNVPLVVTSAMGMSGEAGEFSEIFKKVLFHGKPFNAETKAHCVKELGDVIWYWTNACRAIGVDPNDVIQHNVEKLEARYPGGHFNASSSENRAEGDI